jgi:hypothetical protein
MGDGRTNRPPELSPPPGREAKALVERGARDRLVAGDPLGEGLSLFPPSPLRVAK